jgi:hypothetical protein
MSAVSLPRDWCVFFVKLAQTIKYKTAVGLAQPAMALAFMVEQRFIK